MKNLRLSTVYTSLLLFIFALLQIPVWAQDTTNTKISVTESSTTTTTTWYTEPWVWIVGGAVLLLIIVALVRSGNSGGRDKEVHRTTTVIKDR